MDVNTKKAKSIKNAEKRRERSKVAARCRRGKECEIFSSLSASLPIPESGKSALDKASVMRLTLCNLRLQRMISERTMTTTMKDSTPQSPEFELESELTQALGGFILVFGLDGDVTYASEGITTHLGISQYEIMGQSIFDFSHHYDHPEIRGMLANLRGFSSKDEKDKETTAQSCLFRMKCTLSSRGRNAHLRSANYKVISCVGRVSSSSSSDCFIALCEPLLHPSDVDIPLNKQSFLSKHAADMKFEYVDEAAVGVGGLLGYSPEEMMGRSLFEFCHAGDAFEVGKAFKSLYSQEQSQTDCYRFLAKGGGWVWVLTQATLIQAQSSTLGKTPNSVVCIHFILSGREEEGQVLSELQISSPILALPHSHSCRHHEVVAPTSDLLLLSNVEVGVGVDLFPGPSPRLLNLNHATSSTAKIFAPKTKEMETGFMMPVGVGAEEAAKSKASSSSSEEDLTHLAPIAGDECVLLDDVPMLEDLLACLDGDEVSFTFLGEEEIAQFDQQYPVKQPISPLLNPVMMLNIDPLFGHGSTSSSSSSPSSFGHTSSSSPCGSPDNSFSLSPESGSPPLLALASPGTMMMSSPFPCFLEDGSSPSPGGALSFSPMEPFTHPAQGESGGGGLDKGTLSPPPSKIQRLTGQGEGDEFYILLPVHRRPSGSGSGSGSASPPTCDSNSDESDDDPQARLSTSTHLNLEIQLDLACFDGGQRQTDMSKELLTWVRMAEGGNIPEMKGAALSLIRKRDCAGTLLCEWRPPSLLELKGQDCAVLCPTTELLQGPALLQALDGGVVHHTGGCIHAPQDPSLI